MMRGTASESVRYRIAPLTTYAKPEQMRVWVSCADAGDRCVYAIGPVLGSDPSATLAREFADAGRVHLSRERDGRGFRYFMEKRPAKSAPLLGEELSDEDARLLDLLAAASEAGLPCPSYAEIADKLDFSTRWHARRRMNALMASGRVQIVCEEGNFKRVIIVSGDGA